MLVFFLAALLASVSGSICGIGGGVIIKPVLDMFHLTSVAAINFLSGCTVLSMSCYSVGRSVLSGEKRVDLKTGTPLAVGGAAGGIVGNQMFTAVKTMFENQNAVGSVQALCLMLITLGTLLYTVNKSSIRTHKVKNAAVCVFIGLLLGIMSSFLGIGGGPINLVVLYFFFSMDTKTAAANSLYIILFSQASSLVATLATHTVPEFEIVTLILMVAGGIGGGVLGRQLNRRIEDKVVDRLFGMLMVAIICISLSNVWRYSVG